MMKATKTTNVALAIAAAGMFAFAPMATTQAADMGAVKCYGVNSCKGQNDCKTLWNECKGQSSCKGKGFKEVKSEKDCDDMGGSLKPQKS